MESCLILATGICATPTSEFAFWEVTANAFVAIITIVASVAISVMLARGEGRRFIQADTEARRARMIGAFAELCVEFLDAAEAGNMAKVSIRKMLYMSRISVDTRLGEAETHRWMQAASLEILSAIDFEIADADSPDPRLKAVLTKSIAIFDERMDDLRGWPGWRGDWQNYLEKLDIRPVPPMQIPVELAEETVAPIPTDGEQSAGRPAKGEQEPKPFDAGDR